MLSLSEAISTAKTVLPEIFPESVNEELRLDGIEKTDDERFWLITLSHPRRSESMVTHVREYRTVKLRAEDGEVVGARNGFLSEAA